MALNTNQRYGLTPAICRMFMSAKNMAVHYAIYRGRLRELYVFDIFRVDDILSYFTLRLYEDEIRTYIQL